MSGDVCDQAVSFCNETKHPGNLLLSLFVHGSIFCHIILLERNNVYVRQEMLKLVNSGCLKHACIVQM